MSNRVGATRFSWHTLNRTDAMKKESKPFGVEIMREKIVNALRKEFEKQSEAHREKLKGPWSIDTISMVAHRVGQMAALNKAITIVNEILS